MPRLIPCPLILVAAVGIISAAPKPKADEKPVLYSSTRVGDKFVYETVSGGDPNTETLWVTAVEEKGEMKFVSFSNKERGPTVNQYLVSAKGIDRVAGPDKAYDPPWRILTLPAKEGETWEATPPLAFGGRPTKYKYATGKEELVDVPAGKFKAVTVSAEGELLGTVTRTTVWYAPEVGMVKAAVHFKNGDQMRVLKSWTPATTK